MCDPMTILSAGLTAASSGLGIFGQVTSMQGSARKARSQAATARQNAELALLRGSFEESRIRDRNDTVLDNQVASVGARNLDPAYGSPLVMGAMSAAQGEQDALMARAGGVQEYSNNIAQVSSIVSQNADKQRAGVIGIGSQLLSTANSFAGLAKNAMDPKKTVGATITPASSSDNPWRMY